MGLLVAALAVLVFPAAAVAADSYVDATRPDDTGNCLTPATACKTIPAAVIKAGQGDTVFVVDPAVPTTYTDSVLLANEQSLVALSPDPAETIIDNGTGAGSTPAVTTAGVGGGSVEGFTIRSNYQALLAGAPVTVQDDVFDDGDQPTNGSKVEVEIDSSAAGSVVSGNTFVDQAPTAGQNQVGVLVFGSSSVSGNSFDDFVTAVMVGGDPTDSATISGNQITGTRVGNNAGVGILVFAGNPTIVANRVRDPFFAAPADFVTGILLGGLSLQGATVSRNTVVGLRFGIWAQDTGGVITLDDDLIAQSVAAGLILQDQDDDDPVVSDGRAANLTVVDTDDPTTTAEADVLLQSANLVLDSSIVGDKAIVAQGSATCLLSFSRGPTTSGGSCEAFQTSVAPGFAGGGNYHLAPGSPMIDAGNPADPGPGTLDLDGDARAIAPNPGCGAPAPRRDIGADEYSTVIHPPCAPPPHGTTKKKCKKHRKLKKGKCVKKKRKKKR